MIRELNINKQGKCYNRQCGSSRHPSDEECDKVLKPYTFYLALENDDCTDYVTEKYWNTLRRKQIPTVNWRHVNSTLVIPNSFINLYDFKDLRSAADYILKVTQDDDLYKSYFRYRLYYTDYCIFKQQQKYWCVAVMNKRCGNDTLGLIVGIILLD